MKNTRIGTYQLGSFLVDLEYIDDTGGCFYFRGTKNRTPRIVIGFDQPDWSNVLRVLLHETMEFCMTQLHHRYYASEDFGEDHSAYIFVFNHPELSNIVGRVAIFMDQALPDISKAWNKYKKTHK
jgi:hypothetical protein